MFLFMSCQNKGELNLSKATESDFQIVTSSDSLSQTAASELQYYFKEVLDVDIAISNTSAKNKNQICIGNEFLTEERQKQVDSLKEDGFIIVNENNTIHLAGKNGKSNLYAAYAFIDEYLGCKMLTATEYFIPQKKKLVLPVMDKVYEPDFSFRRLLTPGRFDEKFRNWHRLEELDDWGMFVHTFRHLLPPEEYYEAHPEYFSLVNEQRLQDGQLCLSNPEVIKTLTENLGKRMAEKPNKKYWSVSQNDAIQNCECDQCRALDEKFGSVSGTYIHMANQIAEAYPDKQISTLAYQFTRSAPTNIQLAENVNVMFCSIECNRSMPLTEDMGNSQFVQDLEDWSALTNNIFVWDYVVQFKNYLTPFPNFHVLQPNLQLFKEHNIPMMFEQGSNGTWSDFIELKQYLLAQLLWDTDIDVDECTHDFIDMYYGPAAKFIKSYFEMTHEALESKAEETFLDIYGFPQSYVKAHLSPERLPIYLKILDKAEQTVAHDSIYLKRVLRTRLPFDFSYLDIALNAGFESPSFFKNENGQKEIDSSMLHRLDRMVTNSQLTTATTINERSFKTTAYRDYALAKIKRMSGRNLAATANISSATPYSPKYDVGGLKGLTDNRLGGLDFHFNWLGFEGEDMQLDIDFGESQTFDHINMHFLKAVNSWVFLPLEVRLEVSNDGISYRPLAEMKGDQTDRHYLVKSIPFDFKLEKTTVRYLRVVADSMQKCPIWHRGYGGDSWIFIDEVIVN